MRAGRRWHSVVRVRTAYAAIWEHERSPSHVGQVELSEDALRLHDRSRQHPDDRRVELPDIARVRFADAATRLADLKTLVLDLRNGSQLRIAALGLGAAAELHALLSELLLR
jgi:hypothetical protein